MKSDKFEGRVALVTGAAQGMGAAVARRLSDEGARLALLDLKEEPLERLAETFLAPSLVLRKDVSIGDEVAEAVAQTMEAFGRIDILVNAAGVLRPTGIFEMTELEWDWLLDVNLKGAFLVSRAVVGIMTEQQFGRIIHFSSTAGKTVSTLGGCHYTAAKHGVLGLTRALAKELAPYHITVNAVCPGLIDTEMVRQTLPAARIEAITDSFPIARLGTVEEVAELVSFLAGHSYVTGAAIDINGGDLMV